jgi:hypothetical protein
VKPKDTFNYVIFDDKHVEVKAKFSRGEGPDLLLRALAPGRGREDRERAGGAVEGDDREPEGREEGRDRMVGRERLARHAQGKVSKAEVSDFLAQNGVKVEETMLGGWQPRRAGRYARARQPCSAVGRCWL